MMELLGIDTRGNYKDGPLQDVHWTDGSFGYFPCYSLGAMYAAQWFAAMRRQMPDLDARITRGERGTYKTGASRLAVATGVPIVPIAVSAARCWPRKSFLLRPGVIDVSIGAPIPSVGRRAEELMREVEDWIETEMRRLDPEAYAQPAAAAPRVA